MFRPPLGDLILRKALPRPDPQLPEAVIEDRLTAEQRRERCRRLHGTSERARHKPVDRLPSKDVSDRRRGPHPSRLDALIEPTHRPALAVRGRAGVADQVDACRPSLLSLARAREQPGLLCVPRSHWRLGSRLVTVVATSAAATASGALPPVRTASSTSAVGQDAAARE